MIVSMNGFIMAGNPRPHAPDRTTSARRSPTLDAPRRSQTAAHDPKPLQPSSRYHPPLLRMAHPPNNPPTIEVRDLTRDFPAVRALDSISLAFHPSEVHGLIGENGAGKSTLMSILGGILRPTAGRVLCRGHEVSFASPADAQARGIAMIHQELNLAPTLTVAENIFLGREPSRGPLLRRSHMNDEARKRLRSLDCDIDPRQPVAELSIAQQQMVEIAKALSLEAAVLILDEPTAVLTRKETAALFGVVRRLRDRGTTVIYISHILPEVLSLCDRITVMRDGRVVRTLDPKDADESLLANLMVGRELTQQFPPVSPPADDILLRVDRLSVPGLVTDASFELRRGEILGFAGLIGAGRTELAEAIAGLRRRTSGDIHLGGARLTIRSPRDAVRAGIAYLSEDRKGAGLTLDMSVVHNTTIVALRRYVHPIMRTVRQREERRRTREYVERLAIRAPSLRAPVRTLSGGNQQKVAFARWLETMPRVLILDEPTRGVDVGAKREIYHLIARFAADGKGCIVISSELTELLGLCHRIAVMRQGRIVGMLDRADASEERVMRLAAGVQPAGAAP